MRRLKRMISAVLVCAVLASGNIMTASALADERDYGLSNPRREEDGAVTVTWDCVYFGSYPQAEVVPDLSKYTAIVGEEYLDDGDIIEDAGLCSLLETADYDDRGYTTISENSYKRIRRSDASYVTPTDTPTHYQWDGDGYHYFKCEPIKWRVLSVDGDDAFLLADKGIDDQPYHDKFEGTTWEECSIRGWLNEMFMEDAFSEEEQNAIRVSSLVNADNPDYYYATPGGNDTSDKIFLLSIDDALNMDYGFYKDYWEGDTARWVRSSTYSKAMGTFSASKYIESVTYGGNCSWMLRSPGNDPRSYADVGHQGRVSLTGGSFHDPESSVRPALHLDLSAPVWEAAGEASSTWSGPGDLRVLEIVLAVGQKYFNPELAKPSNRGIFYKAYEPSYDKVIAVINSKGLITAKGEGTANITLEKGDLTYSIVVYVVDPKFQYENRRKKYFTTNVGENITPDFENCRLATTFSIPLKQQKYAVVDAASGEVTPVKKGVVKLTATIGEGKYAKKISTKVRIYDPVLRTYKGRTTVKVGKTLKASVKGGVKTTEWSSSDENIAVVRNGKIKGINPGTVIITAVNNGRTMKQEITVE